MDDEKRLTILEHLEELRGRLVIVVVAVVVTTAFSLLFTEQIFDLLKSRAEGIRLIRTGMTEMLTSYMKVATISGVVLAMPIILYEIVLFVAPALTPKEKRYFLLLLLPGILLSFVVGVLFAYFVLLPPALTFLIRFGENIAEPLIKVGDYVSLVVWLMFWIGVAFETPLVIFFLASIGILSPQRLARFRPYAFVGAFILSAIITPTFDPINQALVAVPLILLYELGILLARLAWRRRR